MKKLVVAAFASLALAQLGTGCIIISDDDDDPIIDSGELDITWDLRAGDLEESPTVATCPPGGTIEVVAEDLNGTNTFANMFDCALGRGIVTDLPFSDYVVHLNLYSGPVSPANLIARSDDRVFAIDDLNITRDLDYTMTLDHGRIGFSWTIEDAGATITCAAAGAQDTNLRSVLGNQVKDDLYECADGKGDTRFLPLNEPDVESYALSLSLFDSNTPPTVLSRATIIETDIVVAHEVDDIGNINMVLGQIEPAP